MCIERVDRRRRGRGADRRGAEPVPGDGRAARRAGAESRAFRLEVELGSMPSAFFTAVRETVRVDAAARPVRLAGHRLRRHDDPLRLLAAAEPRARHVRQEHVLHRPRLPPPHAVGAGERPAAGGHGGVRAGARVPPGDPGRHARRGAARAGPRWTGWRTSRSCAARWRSSPARSPRRACTACAASCPGSRAARRCWSRGSTTTGRCAAPRPPGRGRRSTRGRKEYLLQVDRRVGTR